MESKINEGELTKRIKALVLQERYEEALRLLDGLDISRIKNVSILCLAGEVYMGLKHYEDAEQVLLRVYEKSPNTRRILDLLTTLYIEKGDYSEAEYYYKEFIGVASRDLHRYILRYRLDKGKGERSSVLIDTLEKLKDYEYIEEWAYELATLYDACGETKKCIHECEEIILWFGYGEYVDKAIALKCRLTGEPLPVVSTVEQHLADVNREMENGALADDAMYGMAYDGSMIDLKMIEDALKNQTFVDDDGDDEDDDDDEIIGDSFMTDEVIAEDKDSIAEMFNQMMFGSTAEKKTEEETTRVEEVQEKESEEEPLKEMDDAQEWSELFVSDEPSGEDLFGHLMGTENASLSAMMDMQLIDDDDEDDDDEVSEELPDETITEMFVSENTMVINDVKRALWGTDDIADENTLEADREEMPAADDSVQVEENGGKFSIDRRVAFSDEDENSDSVEVSDTVMDIFGSVAGVRSIKEQLARTFTRFEDQSIENMDLLAPYDINFVVTGDDMSVKSQIAVGIAKALNTYGICDKNKLVRATAGDLNQRDFSSIFGKLKGGCLIVENAGDLEDLAESIIADYVQQDGQDVAIVLEGEEGQIKHLFKKYPVLHAKFLNIIHIGKYDEDELVRLAVSYAKTKGYEVSQSAAMLLRRMLHERIRDDFSVNYEDLIAIIDEAIANLEKRNMKNLFMTVLDNKYEEASMFMLQTEDFDNISLLD